ncbi:hypothetical protein BS78_02G165500 [Paspalum vaginatum]|nr:hypothetical protein BS78_02G165500 [Paspalum vaginatum]
MSTGTIPMARCAGTVNTAAVAVCGQRRRRCTVVTAAATATSAPRGVLPRSASGSRKNDYYAVLSLEHSAAVGAEEIKRAYRRLSLRHHPDVCPASRRAESTERFLELRRAYETLSDPARRVRYDAGLMSTGGEPATRPGVELARSVWESQLCVLRARSERRQRARSSRTQRPVC